MYHQKPIQELYILHCSHTGLHLRFFLSVIYSLTPVFYNFHLAFRYNHYVPFSLNGELPCCKVLTVLNNIYRQEKICKGQPCTTEVPEIYTTHQMEQLVQCKPGWTEWINHDKDSFTKSKTRKKKIEKERLPSSALLVNIIWLMLFKFYHSFCRL